MIVTHYHNKMLYNKVFFSVKIYGFVEDFMQTFYKTDLKINNENELV